MSIEILEKTLYVLNYDEEKIELREPPEEFDEYINKLVIYINSNQTIRMYKNRAENTQVINAIKNIIELYQEKTKEDKINVNVESVAKRLFRIEQNTQERINRLDVKIKKGSLVQVLCYDTIEDFYEFLIAKVEHNEFWDDRQGDGAFVLIFIYPTFS